MADWRCIFSHDDGISMLFDNFITPPLVVFRLDQPMNHKKKTDQHRVQVISNNIIFPKSCGSVFILLFGQRTTYSYQNILYSFNIINFQMWQHLQQLFFQGRIGKPQQQVLSVRGVPPSPRLSGHFQLRQQLYTLPPSVSEQVSHSFGLQPSSVAWSLLFQFQR